VAVLHIKRLASLSSQPEFLNQAAKLSSLHIVSYRHLVFEEEENDNSHEIEDSLHKMRLLNVKTMKLEEYFGSRIPEYAILSHCVR
jgi:hypothetical protein